MIIFKVLRFQNFLSYGNNMTEIKLNSNKNTLVIGKNGYGKSSWIDALVFALYGKPYRNINKPQLVNSIIEKNLLVELEFSIDKKNYLIRRGLKPNIFEIYINDELVKQDNLSKDYQLWLENNILKINYKSFCQIVVLGSSNYIPFMQLPAHARRNIIEDLLDLQVFSSMNLLLKERVVSNKEEYVKNEYDTKLISSNLSLHENHLKSIKIDIKEQTKKLKNSLNEYINKLKSNEKEKKYFENELTRLNSKVERKHKFEELKDKILTIIKQVQNSISRINKEIEFFGNSCECPTCKQEINEKIKNEQLNKLNKLQNSKLEKIKGFEEKQQQVELKLKKINETLKEHNTINQKIISLNNEIFVNVKFIETTNDSLKQLKEKTETLDLSKKQEFENNIKLLKQEKIKLNENRELLSIASQLLKDGGIKTIIIKQYIPIINKIINQYLNLMNFFIEFNIDDNFQETIKSRHRDEFSYNNFSEGEKTRINLAILFAWRAITKMRNTASTNLLIFDEIFDSSLDIDGTEDFMKILNTLTNDNNVFIISHKTDQISDKFDHILKVEKHKNFSSMEMI